MMKPTRCVISVADHAGWARLICVATPGSVPAVVERRRVTLIDPGPPTMPYHHESLGMRVEEADALIARATVDRPVCLTCIACRRRRDDACARFVSGGTRLRS